MEEIARMFGVSRVTVWKIKNPRPGSRFWGTSPKEFDRERPMAGLSRRRRQ